MVEQLHYSSFSEYCSDSDIKTYSGFKDISPYDEDLIRLMKFICKSFNVPQCLISPNNEEFDWYLLNRETNKNKNDKNYKNYDLKAFAIKDTLADESFSNDKYVQGYPKIRFCVSVKLNFQPFCCSQNNKNKNPSHYMIGSVCMIDTKPHNEFDIEDKNNFVDNVASIANNIWNKSANIRDIISITDYSSMSNLTDMSNTSDKSLHSVIEMDSTNTPVSIPDALSSTVNSNVGLSDLFESDAFHLEDWSPRRGVGSESESPCLYNHDSNSISISNTNTTCANTNLDTSSCSSNILNKGTGSLTPSSENQDCNIDHDTNAAPAPLPLLVPVLTPKMVKKSDICDANNSNNNNSNSNNTTKTNNSGANISAIHFRYSISGIFSKTPRQIYGAPTNPIVAPTISPVNSNDENSLSLNRSISLTRHTNSDSPKSTKSKSKELCSSFSHNEHDRSHIKVLLMEDSVLVQKVLTRLFEQQGCEVKIAKNGKIGLEMLQTEDFDVAFIDFLMPIQDGVTTMRLHKEYLMEQRKNPDYKVGSIYNDQMILVGISDVASDGEKTAASYNDMHVFCSKPLDPELLSIILDARRKANSLDEALSLITEGTMELMKRKVSLVTAMGQLSTDTANDNNADDSGSGSVLDHTPSNAQLRIKPQSRAARKHAAHTSNNQNTTSSNTNNKKVPILSWWRKITENFTGYSKSNNSVHVHNQSQSHTSSKMTKNGPPSSINYSLGGHMNIKRPVILIMDDSILIQKVLSRLFMSNNCEVVCVSNGEEGLALLLKQDFDVVFVDFFMPIQDGVTTLRKFHDFIKDEYEWINKGYVPGTGVGTGVGSSLNLQSKEYQKGKTIKEVRNSNTLLIGMSDNITADKTESVFENNNLHFYCSKPISNDLLMIVMKAVKTYDLVDDMLVYIEQNVAKQVSNNNKKNRKRLQSM